jgi:hypothetical protein
MRIQVNQPFGLQINGTIHKFTVGAHELTQAEAEHWYTKAAIKEGWAVKLEAEPPTAPPVEPPVKPPVEPPVEPPVTEPPAAPPVEPGTGEDKTKTGKAKK